MEAELPPVEAADFWTATYTLMGLRYDRSFAAQVLRGVRQMRESSTYQAILEEGRQEAIQSAAPNEARRILLIQGRVRFGEPSAVVLNRLQLNPKFSASKNSQSGSCAYPLGKSYSIEHTDICVATAIAQRRRRQWQPLLREAWRTHKKSLWLNGLGV